MSRKSGIVNVRMVITEEKILSNIDKVQKLINPKSKKQIVQFEEDTYFKDLIESIKAYLIEYPKKKNFPISVYKAAYELVEFATNQFEENTKKVEELIRQREENITLAGKLKDLIEVVENKNEDWKDRVNQAEEDGRFSEDVIETLRLIGKDKTRTSQNYQDAIKLLNARVNNLETNLHIEIDMERIEDRSKALSYIGIEVAEALKVIPRPIEMDNTVETKDEVQQETKVQEVATIKETKTQEVVENKATENKIEADDNKKEKATISQVVTVNETEEKDISKVIDEFVANNEVEQYEQSVSFEKKPSLWQKFKKSKFARAITYVFKIRIRIELPNALPEGRGE